MPWESDTGRMVVMGFVGAIAILLVWRQRNLDLRRGVFPPRRMKLPIAMSLLVFLGVIIYWIHMVTDPSKDGVNLNKLWQMIICAGCFAAAINFKALVGPAWGVIGLSAAVYNLLEYGYIKVLPVIEQIFSVVWENAEDSVKLTYYVTSVVYVCGWWLWEETHQGAPNSRDQ